MVLVFIAMLPTILLVISLIVTTSLFFMKIMKGKEFNKAILLSFIVPGLGIAYLGAKLKGILWYLVHFVAVVSALLLNHYSEFNDRFLGAVIMLPFFIQMYVTAIDYKKHYGDLASWRNGK